MEHEMSTAVAEKVFGKYKLLSPDFRFFLPMISGKFDGSGSRYTSGFPICQSWKNASQPSYFLWGAICVWSRDFRRRISRKVDTFGRWRLKKCTSPVSRPREQRLSFFTLLNFSLVGVATLAALVWLLGDPLRLLLGWGAFSLVLVKVLLDYSKQMPQHSSHTHSNFDILGCRQKSRLFAIWSQLSDSSL